MTLLHQPNIQRVSNYLEYMNNKYGGNTAGEFAGSPLGRAIREGPMGAVKAIVEREAKEALTSWYVKMRPQSRP